MTKATIHHVLKNFSIWNGIRCLIFSRRPRITRKNSNKVACWILEKNDSLQGNIGVREFIQFLQSRSYFMGISTFCGKPVSKPRWANHASSARRSTKKKSTDKCWVWMQACASSLLKVRHVRSLGIITRLSTEVLSGPTDWLVEGKGRSLEEFTRGLSRAAWSCSFHNF